MAVRVLAVFQVVLTGIGERGMPGGASPLDLDELACREGSCGQALRIGGLTGCWLGGEPSNPANPDSWRRLGRGEKPRPNETVRSKLIGLKPAHVWDVSQTDGEPLPEIPRPRLLQGQAPEGLWDGLADQITDRGFGLRLVSNAASIGGANGLTDYLSREVSVGMDMDDSAQVKTLAHELGHVMLHDPDNADVALHRGTAEVEAESVALMACSAHTLATDDYTIPYVATWASSVPGRTPVEVVQSTADRVRGAAVQILDKLDTTQGGDGKPPGLDREALATTRDARPARPGAQRQVEVLGL